MSTDLQRRVTKRASDLIGGPAALAAHLGVTEAVIRAWLSLDVVYIPPTMFFEMVDLLQAADPGYRPLTDNATGEEPRQPSPGDRGT